jgi:hypothetical protein
MRCTSGSVSRPVAGVVLRLTAAGQLEGEVHLDAEPFEDGDRGDRRSRVNGYHERIVADVPVDGRRARSPTASSSRSSVVSRSSRSPWSASA